ncbi:hypothetical protein PFISCL1PPCAC_15945, partial [Pristionchus fissidentatus]
SPFFARVLGKSSTQHEITIHAASVQGFAALLYVLNGVDHSITDDNVESLLHLAERFQFQPVIDAAEEFLLFTENCSLNRKLKLADSYKLKRLETSLLPLYSDSRLIVELIDSNQFCHLSDSMRDKLLQIHERAVMDGN